MESKKRNIWTDNEVGDMLSIINDKHIMELLDNKCKRNKEIYEEVAEELRSKGCMRTGEQVKMKFKALKCDFYKAKRNNNKSGAQRQTCAHFDLLNAVLGKRPVLTAEGFDTSGLDDDICLLIDGTPAVIDSDLSLESNSLSTENTSSVSSLQPKAKANNNNNTFKKSKKRTYEKVVESFTKDWKSTQEDILVTSKEQDKEYMGNIEELLDKNRNKTARLMEIDREETAKMLGAFISMIPSQVHPTSPFQFPQFMNTLNSASTITAPTSPPNI